MDRRARYVTLLESPVGLLRLESDGVSLTALRFEEPGPNGRGERPTPAEERAAPFPQARGELREYFAGRRTVFTIPLAAHGTPFQERVWDALRRIPHGATASYAEIARAVGAPRAARAVGAANARNPLAIVVPCHRVIASGGGLGGYAGGTARKRALLDLEAAASGEPRRARGRRRAAGP